MKFKTLCRTYSKVEKISGKIEMVEILSETLCNANADEIGKIALLTLGKIYPNYVGIELMLAESMTIKALSITTGKSTSNIKQILEQKGDLGSITYKLLSKKTQTTLSSFTGETEYAPEILEVWSFFDKLAKLTGEGSSNKKINLLAGMLSRVSAIEAKYIVRIVSSKLRLGIATQLLLEALALAKTGNRDNKDILEKAYNRCSDIEYVAETLYKGGIEKVKEIDIRVFSPVKVMLAQRLSSSEEILEKFGEKCAVEYKYDGIRAQIHVKDNIVKIFSRNNENITYQFPDVQNEIIKAAKKQNFIVEGEIVAYDEKNNKILPFQSISRRKRKHDIEEKAQEIPVRVFLFDVLFANNCSTLNKLYLERRKLLKELVNETETIRFSHQTIVSSVDELETFFNSALEDNCEGIMVKSINQDSIYQAGARGWLWVKYKADYVDKLSDSFDLVIIGADYGKGKRTGKYGTFLLACFDTEEGNFKTFTRVATGFSDKDLDFFYQKLSNIKLNNKPKEVVSEIECSVWFEPKIVIEVTGAEITISQLHTCARGWLKGLNDGLALRFPRFTGRIVEDKNPEDATTVNEIVTIFLNQKGES
ncbi:MAG: ATP-dependent DNA ligase [Candidatus Heimdallarchaeum endolithica]|uniref:DNA ligase n=1 Tax=Candidatus Heimdallarchaeum endolithica TaxID=2876572 RepID=A0A9Y1BTA4_9ARCH|nr:MAG: ATP-dependent DNA ligase [Candidatus Heimdallarchaeum endolithica]